MANLTNLQRFWQKINATEDGCWLWTAGRNHAGYGQFHVREGDYDYRNARAHRWAYETFVGPIPDGLQLDHLCRRTECVNPWHLEPVDNETNWLRGDSPSAEAALRQECANGHPLVEGNVRVDREGHRRCRACNRDRMRRARAA